MAIKLKYATTSQLGAALRERFKIAEKEELYRLSLKIKTHYDLGDLTDEQMKKIFSATNMQWADLKTKITSYATAYDAMQNAKGE